MNRSKHLLLKTLLIFTICFMTIGVVADDYFWIGGSGNWSDINHWSQTSGGTVLHIQIPTSSDNVYFDANSFTGPDQTVTVNTENAICENMDWSGALYKPAFTSTQDNNLQVYGSVIFTDDMVQDFQGTFTFEGTAAGNVIKSSGKPFLNHIIFDGIGGEWTLQDDLTVMGMIIHVNGNFILDGMGLTCDGFTSTEPNPRLLDISNSAITIFGSLTIGGLNISLSAMNSLLTMSGSINCTDGDTLDFHNVDFITSSGLYSSNIYSRFNTVHFLQQGLMEGSCFADSVVIDSLTGTLEGEVTANYTEFNTEFATITGNNFISNAIANFSCKIAGTNTIGFIEIMDSCRIEGTNNIQQIIIHDTGIINQTNTITNLWCNGTAYISGTNTISNAYLNNDGFIFGNNQFNTLSFSAGSRYFLEYNTVQTIHTAFNVSGTCEAPIMIKSTYNGLSATIQKTNGGIEGDFLSLRDIHVNGQGTFVAANSVDLGNNEGWTIETAQARDLFWVNGQGNWDDQEHWSESAGGPSGACPPTELDNVFFDANSFTGTDTVIINVKNAVCNTMDWTGSTSGSALGGADTNFLKIYGSLRFSQSMTNAFGGEVHFESILPDRVIDAAGSWFNNNVRIQGRNGVWMLEEKMQVADTLFFEHGTFISNNNNILTGQFFSVDTNFRSLHLGTDSMTITGFDRPLKGDTAWRLNARNLSLTANSSTITVVGNDQVFENFYNTYLEFNNLIFKGNHSTLVNSAYGKYNLVVFEVSQGKVRKDCTIDTVIFHGSDGKVYDSDTIKTALFYGGNGVLEGEHIVEIAYYYEGGMINGQSHVDTALFYSRGTITGNNTIDTTIISGIAKISGENVIRTASLLDRGNLSGNNVFNDLQLTHSKLYEFGAGDKQTIIDHLSADGRCTGPIFLRSDQQGQEAIIEKTNGTITVAHAILRDLTADGAGIPFIATNSVDLGGNTGWEIYEPEAKALYWVGNSGNWSDSLHWSPVSGGEPGYCIPTPIDDVYFDQNSFSENSVVQVDVDIAVCHSMDWTGALYNPIFTDDGETELSIYGSLTLIQEMQQDFLGTVTFASNEKDHQITSAGQPFNSDISFDGRSGSWHLTDSLTVLNKIDHKRGHLSSSGNLIKSSYLYSTSNFTRRLSMDTSTIVVGSIEIPGEWSIKSDSLDIDVDSTLIICYGGWVANYGHSYENSIVYDDINLYSNATLINDSIYGIYDDVIHFGSGDITGNCTIDTLLMYDAGVVSGSDSIHYSHFYDVGTLQGGQHIVTTAIFDGPGTITGYCEVQTALFNSSGSVTGNNIIDTTIFYQNGNIQGNNSFNSKVLIFGNGNIIGSNTILKDLVIHGTATILEENQIHNALLLDWGYLGGSNVYDVLTFSPGKTYTLSASTIQTINDTFNIRGNNCFPITLKSSSSLNVQAQVHMDEGEVAGDFIIMKDIEATGGADFYAGGHSDNIINNTGWIWDDAPGYIFGLGGDTTFLCTGDTLILTTENFNGESNTIYVWFDGTTGPTYTVTEPGDYSLTVYYSEDCAVPGSIRVEQLPLPQIDLGPDGEICEGTTFEISSAEPYDEYLWSNGSTADTIAVYTSGTYWLRVTDIKGCSNSDSIDFEVIPLPDVDLGEDLTLVHGEVWILDAGYPGGSYEWSTGDTTQTIAVQGVEGGTAYWVMVEYAGCSNSDQIMIYKYPYCTVDIPTAFTPNGDGVNDSLLIFGSGIQTLDFRVYDRYGELVFETDDISNGWDGNYNGVKQEQEVYVYYLKAICFDGVITEKKGNVTLLR